MEIINELKRIPLNGTFELTARCNLKCKMCFIRIDNERMKELGGRERTAKEWIDMAKQAADAGTINLLITGGEPLLRPDFCEIYEGIYKIGFVITLYTNATLVTPKIMDTLRKYPPHKIGITIYGASEETYKRVCGDQNAYKKAICGIGLLNELPSIINYRTTVIKDNLEDINKIEKLIKEEFNCESILSMSKLVMKPSRGGMAKVDECRLEPEESARLLFARGNKIAKGIGEKEGISIKNVKYKVERNVNKKVSLYGCDAGMSSYTISWDGKLLGCQMLSDTWTYPFENGFYNSWIEFPQKVNLIPINEDCGNCKDKYLCNSCLAVRLSETGKANGKPIYCCDYVKKVKEYLNK